MAIKITKDGIKEFHITCPVCGCEFTYELVSEKPMEGYLYAGCSKFKEVI